MNAVSALMISGLIVGLATSPPAPMGATVSGPIGKMLSRCLAEPDSIAIWVADPDSKNSWTRDGRWRDSDGYVEGRRILRTGSVDRAWQRRMAQLLGRVRFNPDPLCCTQGPEPQVWMRCFRDHEHADVRVADSDPRILTLESAHEYHGFAQLPREDSAIFELVRRAFPGDALVRALTRMPPPPKPQPPLGKYVYDEELPEVLTRVAPVYPEEARARGITGTLMLQALVSVEGRVAEVRIVKSIPELDSAAVSAVKQWRFKPATANDKPVALWVGIPIKFPSSPAPAAPMTSRGRPR